MTQIIERWMLPYAKGNPVAQCWLYERIAFKWNYVRANKPNWLHEIRSQRIGPVCQIRETNG